MWAAGASLLSMRAIEGCNRINGPAEFLESAEVQRVALFRDTEHELGWSWSLSSPPNPARGSAAVPERSSGLSLLRALPEGKLKQG